MNSGFQDKLAHTYAAYRAAATWCIEAGEHNFPIDLRGLRFERASQLQAVMVELGWAFVPRFYAILEQYHRAICYKSFKEFKDEYLVKKFDEEAVGKYVELAKLRHIILHGDGDEKVVRPHNWLGIDDGCEPHVLPEHMEQFISS